jgi:diguanylate cyclase (GGDEF)-like protein
MNAIKCLSPERLLPILERKRTAEMSGEIPRFPLDVLLISILDKANAFVPSASGSILLDDPRQKTAPGGALRELVFVCCFGPAADRFLGERLGVEKGIVGAVYTSGVSRITNDAYATAEFAHEFDLNSGYATGSVLCVPIRIGGAVCGVIELINCADPRGYREEDRDLLDIFAHYISSTIQNALDAKRIARMVITDDLTRLSNDRHLHEVLTADVEKSRQNGTPLSAIFLDLDHFKGINDQHGHLAGSLTLKEFGALLRRVVPGEKPTLARYGGDEFVAVLPDTGMEEVLAIAESIRAATEVHVFLDGPWGENEPPLHLKGVITASIGVATLLPGRAGGTPAESASHLGVRLLQAADQAMYLSKERGKNAVTALPFR